MENNSYPVTYNPASNAPHINRAPMPTNYQPYAVPSLQQQQQPYFPYMQQLPQQPPLPMQYYHMYPFPTHNFNLIPIRQPLIPVNQFYSAPPCPSPIPQQVYVNPPPPSTPTSSRVAMHNASLNASFGATSFNDTSIRYNPLAGRRSRDHSLVFDQSTNSTDRSFQQPLSIDPQEMANNFDLISYCFSELCRKQLTEQELVTKVTRSRKFRRFGKSNLPSAISIILNTFPYFISTTVILKACTNDLPFSKTIWRADKNFQKPRGSKLNATMFEIPERVSSGGEVLSVLGDIASLNLDENKPPTSIASVEKILEGVKV